MIRIIDETADLAAAREDLLDAAFGAARFAKTSERLREDRLPAEGLAFAAMDGDRLVGTVRLWNVTAGPVAQRFCLARWRFRPISRAGALAPP